MDRINIIHNILGAAWDNKKYTMKEVQHHNTKESGCWFVFRGSVYNVTSYLHDHPSGMRPFVEPTTRLIAHMYMCIYVYVYICMFVCLYVCMFVCLYVCMFVYIYIYLYMAHT